MLKVIAKRINNTLILGGIGFVLTFAGSLLLGILCAWFEESWLDRLLCKLGTIISCIPEFWFSLVLILVFCLQLKWLPSSGAYSVGMSDDLLDRIKDAAVSMASSLPPLSGDIRQIGGDAFIRFATDWSFEMPAVKVAMAQRQFSPDVWMYRYELITKSGEATGWKALKADHKTLIRRLS